MADLNQILKSLVDRSRDQKITWRTTASPETYMTTIGEVSVAVSIASRQSGNTLYELEIIDSRGVSVENLRSSPSKIFSSPAGQQRDEMLRRLFESARRSALDIDSTLDELARQLDQIV